MCFLAGCGHTGKDPQASGSAISVPAPEQARNTAAPTTNSLPAGTAVPIEISEVLDSGSVYAMPFMVAKVVDDVKDSGGGLAIPADSHALLVIRQIKAAPHAQILLGLNRVDVAGKTFKTVEGAKDLATLLLDEDAFPGAGHRSVHLEKRSRITFKLETPVRSQ